MNHKEITNGTIGDVIETLNNGVEGSVIFVTRRVILRKYKIYIIDEIICSQQGVQRTVKTLEKVRLKGHLHSRNSGTHKIPATIISRTQRLTLDITSQEIIDRLAYI